MDSCMSSRCLVWSGVSFERLSRKPDRFAKTFAITSLFPVNLTIPRVSLPLSTASVSFRKLTEAVESGRETLGIVRLTGNKEVVAKVLENLSGFLESLSNETPDQTKQRELMQESIALYEESRATSRESCLREISHPLPGFHQVRDPNVNRELCEEALRIVRPNKDNFAIGR